MVRSAEKPTFSQSTAQAPPAPPKLGGAHRDGAPRAGGPGNPPDPPKRRTGGSGGGGDGDDGSGRHDPSDDAARKRLTLIVAGVGIVVLIVLFVILQNTSNDGTTARTPPDFPVATQSQAKAAAAATNPVEKTIHDSSLPKAPAPAGGPATDAGPILVQGSVTKIKVKQGDTVAFQVKTGPAQEVHVHGYDKKYELAAGETKAISFKATITGIFEVEFENTSTQIGELTVEP